MRKNSVQAHGNKPKPANKDALKAARLIQEALALHKDGQLVEAAERYLQVLSIDGVNFDALHFLGMIRRGQHQLEEALSLVERAVKINPANLPVHATYGNLMMDSGRHEAAIASYERFLSVMPDFPEVINNKGSALSALARHTEALACYERALQLQPDYLDVYFNRGNLYLDMRRYAEALSDYQQVLRLNPRHFQALNNQGNALQKLGRLPEAAQSYQLGLSLAPGNAELHSSLANACAKLGNLQAASQYYAKSLELHAEGFTRHNAALQLAILHYLYGNQANVEPLLNVASGMLENSGIKDQGSLIYCVYMLKIQAWWQQFRSQPQLNAGSPTDILYVIGESHMLSTHQLLVSYAGKVWQCKGHWIEGCTQWRIGNQADNHYKQRLATFLQSFPIGATVLITVGEIDCRIDGGILKAWKKTSAISLQQFIHDTIAAYLKQLVVFTEGRQQKIIISGVPAANLADGVGSVEERAEFGNLLSLFNQSLQQQALQLGMDFLDVFSMTDAGNGRSNQQWHIDVHHLRPDAVQQAFNHHVLRSVQG
ncbi:tetratricopeptide repeat protein [Undibacterium sp. CY18W]|uniref:Tetratricopeptide repeat protein n=1 Tax=Undibacterium hunanense TaxID=2762292 RepID=A0ABR6ZT21_9BURK|nr:tetratricopeptide repeat protein [Undibacterium hunanense]MBC3918683.1 tetratricopeptide repeat protein [Undibacterium hunanense]